MIRTASVVDRQPLGRADQRGAHPAAMSRSAEVPASLTLASQHGPSAASH